jgi:hypothetical protein
MLTSNLFSASSLFGAMTMHILRGREAEYQLSLCMIAMRTLETMYPACGWVRKIFYQLREKRFNYGISCAAADVESSQPQTESLRESFIPEARDDVADFVSHPESNNPHHHEPPLDEQHQALFSQDLNSIFAPYSDIQDGQQEQQYLAYMLGGYGEIGLDALDQFNLANISNGSLWENSEMLPISSNW